MSDQHFTNIFNINGNGNTINVSQSVTNDSGGAEAAGMVLKFMLAFIGLLLSPVLVPILLTVNGVKMLQERGQGDNADDQ